MVEISHFHPKGGATEGPQALGKDSSETSGKASLQVNESSDL